MTRSVLRGLRAAALTGTLVFASGAYAAENPIKLGVLEDQSGDFAAATIGKVHAIQLAAVLTVHVAREAQGLSRLTLVSADHELNTAAAAKPSRNASP